MRALLLSTVIMGKDIVLKFYDPLTDRLILWKDQSNYRSYCYMLPSDTVSIKELRHKIENVHVNDIIQDKPIELSKVTVDSPFEIYGLKEGYKVWEGDVKHFQNYLYDQKLVIGKWYEVGEDIMPLNESKKIKLDNISTEGVIEPERFNMALDEWASLLSEDIPKIKRLAFDIEVEVKKNTVPDPLSAPNRVTAIGFYSDDISKVFILNRDDVEMGERDDSFEYKFFDTEKEMLEESFKIIDRYPMVLTYNGDTFDMPYLYNRAIKLGIRYIPFKMMDKNATVSMGIHIDLYGVFKNRSLKAYAFNAKYVRDGLGEVSQAMLGETKTEYKGELTDIPLFLLGKYCLNDCRLTYNLTAFNSNLVMNLLIILSRIANMPIDEISRRAISAWIRSMLHFEHRKRGELIPRNDDFPKVDASTVADIKDRKYKGAVVLDQKKGIHFDVTVMDFASLYPSIIKTKNISYETVCCVHEECRKNIIPQTKHWACTKRSGTISIIIGSLKELRVNHFKKLMRKAIEEGNKKDEEKYDMITQALKVYLNASYGVMGAEIFSLYYLPMAESVTSYGRDIIQDTANTATKKGMVILAGDTDSLFIHKPTKEQIDSLIEETGKKHSIDLEVDKEYRYLMLSGRKKNYFGIKKNGSLDIKGLTGKKSHTPLFLRNLFDKITDELKKIESPEQFAETKIYITSIIKEKIENFDDISMEDLAFNVKLSKNIHEYNKTTPQVVKAAKQFIDKPSVGDFIRFVKTWNEPHVKPIQLASKSDIDKPKYMEFMEATLEQITDPMDIDFDILLGRGKITQLTDFL